MNERKGRPRRKVLIIDDHPVMRMGLARLIGREPDLAVSGEANTAAQALNLISARKPDVVVLDLSLPDRSGLDLLKDVQVFHPGLPTLVFSEFDESVYAERVLRAGGRGYVMKQESGRRLVDALRQVLGGKICVSDKIASRILENYSGQPAETKGVSRLTDREFQVLQRVGQGESTREIARHLNLSVKTVEVHRGNIKRKLGLKSTAEMMRHAIRCTESGRLDGHSAV